MVGSSVRQEHILQVSACRACNSVWNKSSVYCVTGGKMFSSWLAICSPRIAPTRALPIGELKSRGRRSNQQKRLLPSRNPIHLYAGRRKCPRVLAARSKSSLKGGGLAMMQKQKNPGLQPMLTTHCDPVGRGS